MGAYLALVHHPVRDRQGRTLTTAVTNLDVHDLARLARAYDLSGYFVVTPIDAQRALVDRIVAHWETSRDGKAEDRFEALRLVSAVPSVEAAAREIEAREGRRPRTVATAASAPPGRELRPYADLGAALRASDVPHLILFGTGHGLAPELVASCDEVVPPLRAAAAFNHLSVRAAAAIVLDRLLGESGPPRV